MSELSVVQSRRGVRAVSGAESTRCQDYQWCRVDEVSGLSVVQSRGGVRTVSGAESTMCQDVKLHFIGNSGNTEI